MANYKIKTANKKLKKKLHIHKNKYLFYIIIITSYYILMCYVYKSQIVT